MAPFSKLPMIEPASPAEAYLFAEAAFTISESFDTPVLFRMTTRVAHTKENVVTGSRREIALKPFATDIAKYVMVPRNAYQKHALIEKRLLKLAAFSETSKLNILEKGDTAKLGFITSGVAYQYLRNNIPTLPFSSLVLSIRSATKKSPGSLKASRNSWWWRNSTRLSNGTSRH